MIRLLFASSILIAAAAPVGAEPFVVCDNGLSCVTEPCPNDNVLDIANQNVTSGVIHVDLSGLPPEELEQANQSQATYYGTLVFGGRIESRTIEIGGANHTLPHLLVTRIEREATANETKLCQSKGPFDGK